MPYQLMIPAPQKVKHQKGQTFESFVPINHSLAREGETNPTESFLFAPLGLKCFTLILIVAAQRCTILPAALRAAGRQVSSSTLLDPI